MAQTQRQVANRFQEALALMEAGQKRRAGDLLLECVVAEPGNAEIVYEFLAHLAAATPPKPSLDEIPHAEFDEAHAEQNWTAVLATGPQQLAQNPWHVPTLLALADACTAQNHDEAAAGYLEHGLRAAPDHAGINRRLGRLLARQGHVAEALVCWQRVESANIDDVEAARMISHLTIRQCRQRAGLEPMPRSASNGARISRAERTPSTQPKHSQSESAAAGNIGRTPIQLLEAAIRDMPSNPALYEELTPLYLEKNREYDAEKLLAEGRKATDDDPRVRKLWEDVAMLRLKKRIALAKKQVDSDPSPEARAPLEQLLEERDHLETEIFLGRCKREPNNSQLKVELGLRLKQAGKLRDARAKFDEALADPATKGIAAFEIGVSLQAAGDLPEALKFSRHSAQACQHPDQLDCRKKALYQAGGLALRLKLNQLAERYLGELLKLDPHYLDAAAWMQEIRKEKR